METTPATKEKKPAEKALTERVTELEARLARAERQLRSLADLTEDVPTPDDPNKDAEAPQSALAAHLPTLRTFLETAQEVLPTLSGSQRLIYGTELHLAVSAVTALEALLEK